MNIEEKALVDIVYAYINNTPFSLAEGIDIDKFIKLSHDQQLLPLVYLVCKNNKVVFNEHIEQQLLSYYMGASRIDFEQQKAMTLMRKVCEDNGIKYCIFKGGDLKSLYAPNTEVRMMGDIDILLSEQDKPLLLDALTREGYEFNSTYNHVDTFVLGKVSVEAHDAVKYFGKNIVSVEDIGENNRFDTTRYLYLLSAHIAKHITSAGCGIRQFMDIAMYIKANDNEIDYPLFYRYMEEMNLLKFSKILLAFVSKYLGVTANSDFLSEFSQDENFDVALDGICSFLLSNGVFGQCDLSKLGNAGIRKFENSKFPKVRAVLYYAFPSISRLSNRYTKLEKYPWLAPYYYICNICRKVFLESGKARLYAKNIKKNDFGNEQSEVLKNMDIFDLE